MYCTHTVHVGRGVANIFPSSVLAVQPVSSYLHSIVGWRSALVQIEIHHGHVESCRDERAFNSHACYLLKHQNNYEFINNISNTWAKMASQSIYEKFLNNQARFWLAARKYNIAIKDRVIPAHSREVCPES